jgi:hypothetical protein
MTWPVTGPTMVTEAIAAYPYVQYQDDPHVGAFFSAYNVYAQAYLAYLVGLNLPVYTNGVIAGPLLDWVAQGIYGISRPALPSGSGTPARGPFNTYALNTLAFNWAVAAVGAGYTATSDDTFKRVITWFFYKGDGKTFTPRWLKRRINRFLNGLNGTDVANDQTYAISVNFTGYKQWTITLATGPEALIFQAAVKAGVIELPFQITWTVTLT